MNVLEQFLDANEQTNEISLEFDENMKADTDNEMNETFEEFDERLKNKLKEKQEADSSELEQLNEKDVDESVSDNDKTDGNRVAFGQGGPCGSVSNCSGSHYCVSYPTT